MRLLVLGGTRYLGRAVVEAALRQGHRVSLFHRHSQGLFPEAEHLWGDRNGDLKSLEGRTFDWVVDTSGQRPSQVRGTAELVECGSYLYVSSVSAYADKSIIGLHEDSEVHQIGPDDSLEVEEPANYGERKVRCEQITREKLGSKAIIVRPGLIVGSHDFTDRFTYWPMRCSQGGTILAPGRPDDPVQWIDVRDLADFMLLLLSSRASGTYNAVGSGTIGQVVAACQEVVGLASPVHWLSAAELEKYEISPWQDMPAWVPADGDAAGFVRIDNTRALRAGLQLRPLRETVEALWHWRRATGEPLKAGLTRQREAAVLARVLGQ